jgi:hypothetical protein
MGADRAAGAALVDNFMGAGNLGMFGGVPGTVDAAADIRHNAQSAMYMQRANDFTASLKRILASQQAAQANAHYAD